MFHYWSLNRFESIVDGYFLCLFEKSLEAVVLLIHDVSHSFWRRECARLACLWLFYFFHDYSACLYAPGSTPIVLTGHKRRRTFPIKRFFGTGPQYLESELADLLSPITKNSSFPRT